jgi:hypothetical protein
MLLALVGLLLTVIWLLGGIWYVAEAIGFENLLFLLPGELGQFATGFLLPLVLLWLVLGYLHIGQRLRQLEEALWEMVSMRLARGGSSGGSPAPDDGGWLGMESDVAAARGAGSAAPAAAPQDLRPLHPAPGPAAPASAAGSGASSHWAERRARVQPSPQPAPQSEAPRRGGLATEIFTSRMRDRMAEDRGARRASPAPASSSSGPAVTPHPAVSSRPYTPPSAAARPATQKPPLPRPPKSRAEAAPPAEQRPAPQHSVPPKPTLSKPAQPPLAPPAPAEQTGQPADVAAASTPREIGATPSQSRAHASDATAATSPSNPDATPAPEAPIAAEAAPPPAEPGAAPESTPETANQAAADAAPPSEPSDGAPAQEAAAPPPAAEQPAPASAASKPIGFRHLVRITSMELNSIAMDLSGLLCRDADHAQALKGYDKGEKDVFFELLNVQLSKQKPAEALKRLQSRGGDQLLANYLRKFDALVTESKGVDRSGALAKSLETMPIGRLNKRLQALRAETW